MAIKQDCLHCSNTAMHREQTNLRNRALNHKGTPYYGDIRLEEPHLLLSNNTDSEQSVQSSMESFHWIALQIVWRVCVCFISNSLHNSFHSVFAKSHPLSLCNDSIHPNGLIRRVISAFMKVLPLCF